VAVCRKKQIIRKSDEKRMIKQFSVDKKLIGRYDIYDTDYFCSMLSGSVVFILKKLRS